MGAEGRIWRFKAAAGAAIGIKSGFELSCKPQMVFNGEDYDPNLNLGFEFKGLTFYWAFYAEVEWEDDDKTKKTKSKFYPPSTSNSKQNNKVEIKYDNQLILIEPKTFASSKQKEHSGDIEQLLQSR